VSGYTGESMMAAAEKHYRTAEKLLGAMDSTWGNVITDRLIHATAHTQAGLLAVELARYALSPDNDDSWDGFQ